MYASPTLYVHAKAMFAAIEQRKQHTPPRPAGHRRKRTRCAPAIRPARQLLPEIEPIHRRSRLQPGLGHAHDERFAPVRLGDVEPEFRQALREVKRAVRASVHRPRKFHAYWSAPRSGYSERQRDYWRLQRIACVQRGGASAEKARTPAAAAPCSGDCQTRWRRSA